MEKNGKWFDALKKKRRSSFISHFTNDLNQFISKLYIDLERLHTNDEYSEINLKQKLFKIDSALNT